MRHAALLSLVLVTVLLGVLPAGSQEKKEKLYLESLDVKVPPIASDRSIRYDYDIVYVRALRAGDKVHKRYLTDFSSPVTLEPGANLMLLHPDGSERS